MKMSTLINKIKEIPAGRYFRLRYTTPVKILKQFRDEGITIFKIVDTTTRTGVQYNRIRGVVPTYSEDPQVYEQHWEWTIKNKVKYNGNTDKLYLVVAPIRKGANTKTTFIMTDSEGHTSVVDKETVAKYALPSYFNRMNEYPKVMNITLDNILMIR